MRWLIFALGVALALGGAASIVSGLPYIRMEFGWTEVIAGTTALSAGIITLGLGAVLSALRRLETRWVESTSSATHVIPDFAVPTAEPMPSPAVATAPVGDDFADHDPDGPAPSVVERDIAPMPAVRPLAERLWTKPSTLGTPEHERSAVPAELARPTDRSSVVRPAASVAQRDRDARRQPEFGQVDVAAPRSYARPGAASLPRADDRVPSLIPSPHPPAAGEATTGPVSTTMEVPTVVGRYESGGASYVLFSDGTIEVETEIGTHRFASMEELKAYIDQQQTSGIG